MDKPSEEILQAIRDSKLYSIQELLLVIDETAIYKLVKEFGGCSISIPTLEHFLKPERNAKIRKDYNSGMKYNQLSQKYGLSCRQLRIIITGR